ncbi:MAG: bifunctional (p)ppGpp synthetase/guanosine-3',5'-bis(diphosphate) 3'-pyrophosphohydrolase [Firmicutes bacterium]|nr:bifunctional (p)ppGpp synthetase/guanosine-3',5'-bis(diphosphate) 3'-pyrophosphohydrolase [Bacillota bacterium]
MLDLVENPEKKYQPDELFSMLIDMVRLYNKNESDIELLKKAYAIALEAHGDQKRASGEPYIIHPIHVALILSEIKMDTPSLIAAIMHDVVEDTDFTGEDLQKEFGKEVANLVDGVTKLSAISASRRKQEGENTAIKSRLDKQAENLKKIFLAMAKDIRVILIKVADRMHNLRTLSFLPEHKQKYISQETLEIFAPIAGRLGMWEFKWQLEDLAFYYLEKEKYLEISQGVSLRRKEREEVIEQVKNTIRKSLLEVGLTDVYIEGRSKHLHSVYQKMKKKDCTLDEVFDLTAVRIVVNTIRECYQVLGIVHNLWMPLKDRFKDYIALPKSNNYRSLHTSVYGPGNEPLEVQIRTWEMHQVNEFGIAAHWAYKEGGKIDINMTNEVYPWIRKILDFEDESKDAREYVENLKLELLDTEVFVFTPKGEVIDLPAGSTPLDFAYTIHTEVGHRCIGAKVNSKIVPIEYQLKNADIVEILTSKHGTPSRDWLKICKSNNAKNKIRQWFKKERREENLVRGREIVERELKRNRLDISLNNADVFGKIARKYNFNTVDDLFASVGYGETSAITIAHRATEMLAPEKPLIPEPAPEPPKKVKRKRKSKSPVQAEGIETLMVKFAKCCAPVRGDDIIGYITIGKGMSVHRKGCTSFASIAKNKDRIINVFWNEDEQETLFTVQLELEGLDRTGLLSEIMNKVNERKIHANSAFAWSKGAMAVIKISIDVKSKSELEELTVALHGLKGVVRVTRTTRKTGE